MHARTDSARLCHCYTLLASYTVQKPGGRVDERSERAQRLRTYVLCFRIAFVCTQRHGHDFWVHALHNCTVICWFYTFSNNLGSCKELKPVEHKPLHEIFTCNTIERYLWGGKFSCVGELWFRENHLDSWSPTRVLCYEAQHSSANCGRFIVYVLLMPRKNR